MKKNIGIFPSGFAPFESLSGMSPKEPMLIALSGGADSRMLFELAARHCRLHGTRFYACHVNHGIRGEEALRDRDFCVALGEKYPECARVLVLNADVPALARERGLGIEHCAREVRYSFFDRIMKENGIRILVTAHNADDSLETLIFNLTRGSGVRGMCGIPKTRTLQNGILIRPMLGIPKSRVIVFCRENSLEYVTDSTNADTDYTRNLIRSRVTPLLEDINPAVRESALRMTGAMTELWGFIVRQAESYITDGGIDLCELKKADPALVPYVLALSAEKTGIDLEAVHIDALRSLCEEGRDGSSLSLPEGFRAVIYSHRLCFERSDSTVESTTAMEFPLSEGQVTFDGGSVSTEFAQDGLQIALSLYPNREKSVNNKNVYKLDIKAHIMFDTIMYQQGSLYFRSRRTGDRILSGGMHKSVKKLMCDKKLPLAVRDVMPMLCSGDEILWIPNVASADGVVCKYQNSEN